MATLDLDARRAEYADETHEVTLAGRTWSLPARFPLLAIERLSVGQVSGTVELLFGPEAVDVLAPLLNEDDLNTILDELYGLDESVSTRPARTAPPKANGNGANRQTRRAAKK